jgi:hypothetical protein
MPIKSEIVWLMMGPHNPDCEHGWLHLGLVYYDDETVMDYWKCVHCSAQKAREVEADEQ